MIIAIVVVVAFLVLGPVLVVLGLRQARRNRVFRATAIRVAGLVTDVRTRDMGHGGEVRLVRFPLLRFTTLDGQGVETEAFAGSTPAPAKVGQTVKVLYDPNEPRRARIETAIDTSALLSGCFIVMGILLFISGIAIALVVSWLRNHIR